MSIKRIWSKRAHERNRRAVLEQLRKVVDSNEPRHISVARVKSALGPTYPVGARSQMCSPAFDPKNVVAIRPYNVDDQFLCIRCNAKLAAAEADHLVQMVNSK